MSKQAFEKKLEALQGLDAGNLRKAIADQNNFYVGKAARRAAALNATELIEPLLKAFERFHDGGAESDPNCWAKADLIQSLYDLGHRDPQVYLLAFRCIQLENVWGGKEDSATQVRALAALALVDCSLDPVQLLRALLPGLTDPAKSVRLETIRALLRLGRWEGELLLRHMALTGDGDPEVLGTTFSAVLEFDQQDAVQFIGNFLESDDVPTRLEAAASLAQARHGKAFKTIMKLWAKILTEEMRRTIVISLGASPLEEAKDFLLDILKQGDIDQAVWAVTALAASRHREDLRATVSNVVEQRRNRQLAQAFHEEYN